MGRWFHGWIKMKAKVRVWLRKDIKGTYYVSGTYLIDGKPDTVAYPRAYVKLQYELDSIFPHLPLKKMKAKVSRIVRKYDYTPLIETE